VAASTPAARIGSPALSGITERVGGAARLTAVSLLAAVLALQAADLATIGAVGAELEGSLGISHFQLGVLAAVAALLGAAATLPFGMLADRLPRVRTLSYAVVLWGLAMIGSGLAGSFTTMLLARLFLGVVIAAAGPLLASLTGDLFPSEERARIYGYILTGELIGSGFGFLVSGNVAGLLSWRWAFWVLALPAWGLAWLLLRRLPEPARGGQSPLEPGTQDINVVSKRGRGRRRRARADRIAQRVVRRRGVEPDRSVVLDRPAAELSLPAATRFVMRVRTNVVLIVVSATGYLFLGGLQTFGVIFVRRNYGLGQSAATSVLALLGVGAVLGVILGGRLADRLLRGGRIDARILVGSAAFCGAALIVLPPFLGNWPLSLAMPLFVLGTAVLSAGNPALDAARLDVIPAGLWGRAEAIRTVLRSLAVALAPLVFGWTATLLGEGSHSGAGLRLSFTLALAALATAGLVLLRARRSYPQDIATAHASERQGSRARDGRGRGR
jgi:MFS family permease